MGKYKSIAVIYGSDSSEWEVSCRSGEYVASRMDETAYDIYEIFARFGKWDLVAMRKRNSMRVTFSEGAQPVPQHLLFPGYSKKAQGFIDQRKTDGHDQG